MAKYLCIVTYTAEGLKGLMAKAVRPASRPPVRSFRAAWLWLMVLLIWPGYRPNDGACIVRQPTIPTRLRRDACKSRSVRLSGDSPPHVHFA